MRYPVGTRVWVRLFGALWAGHIHKPETKPGFCEVTILELPTRYVYVAPFHDITAALIPGPTDDPGPLARQLERYAKEAETT